jgi:L-lactate utilization protein LutB
MEEEQIYQALMAGMTETAVDLKERIAANEKLLLLLLDVIKCKETCPMLAKIRGFIKEAQKLLAKIDELDQSARQQAKDSVAMVKSLQPKAE